MPALKPTDYTATVTWLGVVTNDDRAELLADPRERLDLTFEGVAGSVHGGATRASCTRVKSQYPKGTDIRNERQLSIISEEELAEIAALKKEDVAWRKIAWKTCLLDGLKASREQNKPVMLWIFIDRPIDDERC